MVNRWKKGLTLLLIVGLISPASQANKESGYREGSSFAKQVQKQGETTLKNAQPQKIIPNYHDNPQEADYYRGVTAGGNDDLKSKGTSQWLNSDTRQAVNDALKHKQKDSLSPDATFIQPGRDIEQQADKLIGSPQLCQGQKIAHSEFTNYICERDTEVKADESSCKAYVDNPACTIINRKCAFTDENGSCLHENVTFSCETRTESSAMVCGEKLFCLDGSCEKKEKNKNNDFRRAVSQLAAVAAAGKGIAASQAINVKAFTGKAQFCKKFSGGFSNCCQDSGWGHDIGLAKCSEKEKELAKAKERRLTVAVGEFCAKKVLGACLAKKRSYCQFDGLLAQIIQQQGRAWQLGIGFGSPKHPDCRGITPEELQRIQFDNLDFSPFYADLMKNQRVSDNGDALLEKVKARLSERLEAVK